MGRLAAILLCIVALLSLALGPLDAASGQPSNVSAPGFEGLQVEQTSRSADRPAGKDTGWDDGLVHVPPAARIAPAHSRPLRLPRAPHPHADRGGMGRHQPRAPPEEHTEKVPTLPHIKDTIRWMLCACGWWSPSLPV